jgi:hypothetical protein
VAEVVAAEVEPPELAGVAVLEVELELEVEPQAASATTVARQQADQAATLPGD